MEVVPPYHAADHQPTAPPAAVTDERTSGWSPAPHTEIPGLFLAGASTFYNHGVGGVITGGLGTASAILGRDLAQEVRAGRVFADPTKLTEFGPDWDPWLHSKPRAGQRDPGRVRRTTSV